MKLIKIKKMLSKISPWPWYPVIFHNKSEPEADARIWTVGPNEDEIGWNNDADCEGYGLLKKDAVFMAAAPTIIDQLIKQNEIMREALTICAMNPSTNLTWTSPEQIIEGVHKVNDTAIKALKEVKRIEDEN